MEPISGDFEVMSSAEMFKSSLQFWKAVETLLPRQLEGSKHKDKGLCFLFNQTCNSPKLGLCFDFTGLGKFVYFRGE